MGGVGAAQADPSGSLPSNGQAAENVFVPGRASDGPADQEPEHQPFSVRGQARPYREVLGDYAQSGRDYVDRAVVNPAVRDLVKQYFASLEATAP